MASCGVVFNATEGNIDPPEHDISLIRIILDNYVNTTNLHQINLLRQDRRLDSFVAGEQIALLQVQVTAFSYTESIPQPNPKSYLKAAVPL
jgi:hypothetical protein